MVGIRDNAARKRLLQERKLTLNKAIDTCRSAEVTNTQLKTMGEQQTSVPVNKVKIKQKSRSPMKREGNRKENTEVKRTSECKFCGYTHVLEKTKCPAWGKTCKSCSGRNHFAKKCNKSQKTPTVREIDKSSDSDQSEWVSTVKINAVSTNEKEAHAEMIVCGKPVNFQLDCGATVNILPAKYLKNKI